MKKARTVSQTHGEMIFLPCCPPNGTSPVDLCAAVIRIVEAEMSATGLTEKALIGPDGAIRRARRDLVADLRHGALVAYLHRADTGASYIIPAHYWADDIYEEARAWLYPVALDYRIPQEFKAAAIFLNSADLDNWIRFRLSSALSQRGPKPQYDSTQFIEAACDKFDQEGDYSPADGWRPRDMIEHMENWCSAHWGKVPKRTWLQSHIAEARAQFLSTLDQRAANS